MRTDKPFPGFQYNGYHITSRMGDDGVGDVRVYHPTDVHPIYKTTSLDLAAKWIDAYRDGVYWAVAAAESGRH